MSLHLPELERIACYMAQERLLIPTMPAQGPMPDPGQPDGLNAARPPAPNPSRTGVAHRVRAYRRAIRRRAFLMAYRYHGTLRAAFAETGERWLTICGMCRDPAFRTEFRDLRNFFRVQRPHRNRATNRKLYHALDGFGLPTSVKRQVFKEGRARERAARDTETDAPRPDRVRT